MSTCVIIHRYVRYLWLTRTMAQALSEIRRALDLFVHKSKGCLLPRDLLHGTCARFDSRGSGRLDAAQVQRSLKELRAVVNAEQLSALVSWFDADGSGTLDVHYLVASVCGDPPPSLPHLRKRTTNPTTHGRTHGMRSELIAERDALLKRAKDIEGQTKALRRGKSAAAMSAPRIAISV
jgi:hypothetical protein